MAITFPRDFPLDGLFTGESTFEPEYQQTQAITGGGSVNAADLGPAMWQGEFSTVVLSRENFGIWTAWLHSLRGGLRMFKGRPPFWKWPQRYPHGFAGLIYASAQWSGLGNLSVIGAGRDTVTINQLPNGLVLKAGDYFSIPAGSRQHLHRIIEGGTSSGGAVALTVEPVIMPGVATGVAVRFEAPYCEMVIVGKPRIVRDVNRGGSISFTGMQVLI